MSEAIVASHSDIGKRPLVCWIMSLPTRSEPSMDLDARRRSDGGSLQPKVFPCSSVPQAPKLPSCED